MELYYDAEYYNELRKLAKKRPFGKHKIGNVEDEAKFNFNLTLLIRLLTEDKNYIIKRKMCKLIYDDREFYNKLWNWIESTKFGEYEIAKFVKPENREKFDNHIKHWTSTDEFRVFNFYIEFTNDYTGIKKIEYPYNRMSDYNPDGTLKSLDN